MGANNIQTTTIRIKDMNKSCKLASEKEKECEEHKPYSRLYEESWIKLREL